MRANHKKQRITVASTRYIRMSARQVGSEESNSLYWLWGRSYLRQNSSPSELENFIQNTTRPRRVLPPTREPFVRVTL